MHVRLCHMVIPPTMASRASAVIGVRRSVLFETKRIPTRRGPRPRRSAPNRAPLGRRVAECRQVADAMRRAAMQTVADTNQTNADAQSPPRFERAAAVSRRGEHGDPDQALASMPAR